MSEKVDRGEVCHGCGSPMPFPNGEPVRCWDCVGFTDDPRKVDHSELIRCPHCRKTERVDEMDYPKLYGDGEHVWSCVHCDKDYLVSTSVSFSVMSPALEDTP